MEEIARTFTCNRDRIGCFGKHSERLGAGRRQAVEKGAGDRMQGDQLRPFRHDPMRSAGVGSGENAGAGRARPAIFVSKSAIRSIFRLFFGEFRSQRTS
jgi:hypothetical protein